MHEPAFAFALELITHPACDFLAQVANGAGGEALAKAFARDGAGNALACGAKRQFLPIERATAAARG